MSEEKPPNFDHFDQALFAGLSQLASSSFPKRCATCGREYADEAAFIRETQTVNGRSGLKQAFDDDGAPIVELFRNCVCGSTLLDFFSNRRDASASGLERRERFGKVLAHLTSRGIAADEARTELLRLMHNEPTPKLTTWMKDKPDDTVI